MGKSKKVNAKKGSAKTADCSEWTIVKGKNKLNPLPEENVKTSRSREGNEIDKDGVVKVESKGIIQNVFETYGFIESKQVDTNVFFAAAHVRSMLDKSKVPPLGSMFKVGDAVQFCAKQQGMRSGCKWIAEWIIKQSKAPSVTLQLIDPKPNKLTTPPLTINQRSSVHLEPTRDSLNDSLSSVNERNPYANFSAKPDDIVHAILQGVRQERYLECHVTQFDMWSDAMGDCIDIGERIYQVVTQRYGLQPLDILINQHT